MTAHVIPFLSGKRLLDTVQSYIDGTLAVTSQNNDHMIAMLLEGIKIADPELKLKIVLFLGGLGFIKAIQPLYEVMHAEDHSEAVRHMAAIQISVVCGAKKTPLLFRDQLIRDLRSHDAFIRTNAAFALGWERNVVAIGPLIERLRDKESDVRQAAISALCNIGDQRTLEVLGTTLLTRDCEQKKIFLFHLLTVDPKRLYPLKQHIEQLLHDPDPLVKQSAIKLYNKIQYNPPNLTP